MIQHPLLQTLTELASPLAAGLGLSLWGVELILGGRSIVRVYVEAEGHEFKQPAQDADFSRGQGVSIDQCAELSRVLGLALEVEDCIPGAYVLEVSSPGLDRIFFTAEQLAGAVGAIIDMTLHEPSQEYPGRRKFRGRLIAAPPKNCEGKVPLEESFSLLLEDSDLPEGGEALFLFAFPEVKKARCVYVAPEKVRPGKDGKKKNRAGAEKSRP